MCQGESKTFKKLHAGAKMIFFLNGHTFKILTSCKLSLFWQKSYPRWLPLHIKHDKNTVLLLDSISH